MYKLHDIKAVAALADTTLLKVSNILFGIGGCEFASSRDKVSALCHIFFNNGDILHPEEIAQRLECFVGKSYRECEKSFEKHGAKKRGAKGDS